MSLTLEELKWATILALTEPPQRCKPKEEPSGNPYLTFYNENGEFSIRVYDSTKHWDGIVEWSTDLETWTEWDGTTTLSSSNGYLYMRGSGNSVITGSYETYRWVFTGSSIACIGNIENLLDFTLVEADQHPTIGRNCFEYMFYYCTTLTAAPELPATTLATYCYAHMFHGCTSLTIAPELPATTLAPQCYNAMFGGCTSLTTAPELPATTLEYACYSSMFGGCTRLNVAPELPATTLAAYCYEQMFYGCTSLTTAPELPATTLANSCYSNMFYGCTSLTTVPELPATTSASSCYSGMFRNCISLTAVPRLPATVLTNYCYEYMFRGCKNLRISTTPDTMYTYSYRIPTSGTAASAYLAVNGMFTDTGGPFTGTPTINTTYYTDHEPV